MKNLIIAVGLTLVLAPFAVAQQPSAISLGPLSDVQSDQGFLSAGQVAWYQFEIDPMVVGDWFLDVTTNYEDEDREVADTELALFDSGGRLVTSAGDDEGFGLQSTLSFGQGSGLEMGDSFNLGGDGIANGEHGELEAGTHYVAVGAFETLFGDNWQAASNSSLSGTYQVTFYTNRPVPEPSSATLLGLLGLTGLLATRRRQAQRRAATRASQRYA